MKKYSPKISPCLANSDTKYSMSFVSITCVMNSKFRRTTNALRHADLIEADDVFVPEHLQYLHFAVELAKVSGVELALVHDFDRHLVKIAQDHIT